MKAPRKVTVRFRNTLFDCEVDKHEHGYINSIEYNGTNVSGLLFDMGFLADIQTLATEELAQQDIEIAEQLKEKNQ